MTKAWIIAKRDFRTYFSSPIAYIVIAAFLGVMALMFIPSLAYFEQTVMQYQQMQGRQVGFTEGVIRPTYGNMCVILLFLIPFITMKLFAEEKKMHTLELLMTSPVTTLEIVLGKFLASVLFVSVMLALTTIYPLSLLVIGNPDIGPIFGSYLGLVLMGAAYSAVGIFYSAMTENQIVAGALSLFTALALFIINWVGQFSGPVLSDILDQLSLIRHYDSFSNGVLATNDIVFYVSFTGFFLFLTYRVLDSYRWR